MKILVILPSFHRTGPINVAFNIIKDLPSSCIVDVIAFNSGELYEDFKHNTRHVKVLDYFKVILFCYKNKKKYDVVHSHCVVPDFFNAFLFNSKKIKKITTIHNYLDVDYINDKGNYKGKLLSIFHRKVLSKIDGLISCSESVSYHIENNYKISSEFIRNGVDESNFKRRYLDGVERYVIVGVFNKRKNHAIAIDAFIEAKKINTELLVIGNGDLFELYLTKYSGISNIKFTGNVSNVRDYLNKCDVFLSSSLAEGLPMALLESLSENLTYIVSNIEPHIEINKLNNLSGVVVDNAKSSFLHEILKINSKILKERKVQSLKLYNDELTSKIMSNNYWELYNYSGNKS